MVVQNSFKKLLNHSILISKETRQTPCSRAEHEASIFLHKNVMNGYTLFHILYPTPNASLPALSKGAVLFDFPAAYVIARAMFEAYVNMHYLLIDPVSDEEREFRMDRWNKHALTERQEMGGALGSTNPKLEQEREQISQLESRILRSPYFAKLPPNEQQSIRDSHGWGSPKIYDMADKACIHRSQSQFLYKFLSNYAHSEPYSLMQLYDASIEESRDFCKQAATFGEMFLALTLDAFSRLNMRASELLSKNSEVAQVIKFWEENKRQDLQTTLGETSL